MSSKRTKSLAVPNENVFSSCPLEIIGAIIGYVLIAEPYQLGELARVCKRWDLAISKYSLSFVRNCGIVSRHCIYVRSLMDDRPKLTVLCEKCAKARMSSILYLRISIVGCEYMMQRKLVRQLTYNLLKNVDPTSSYGLNLHLELAVIEPSLKRQAICDELEALVWDSVIYNSIDSGIQSFSRQHSL